MARGYYKVKDRKAPLKITACIVAVILTVTGLLTLFVYGSNGFTELDVNKWFKTETVSPLPSPEPKASGYLLIDEEALPAGNAAIRLTSARVADPRTVTVFAEFTPANTTETAVEWSLFMDGANIDQYIKMTVNEAESSATLTCIKPFSTPATLICTSKVKPGLSAERAVHFLKAPYDFSLPTLESATSEFLLKDYFLYDDGTLLPDKFGGAVEVILTSSMAEWLASKGYTVTEEYRFAYDENEPYSVKDLIILCAKDADADVNVNEFWACVGQYVLNNIGDVACSDGTYGLIDTLDVYIDYSYKDNFYGTCESGNGLYTASIEEFKVYPSDVGIGDDVVFG